ncbi:MAG: hypothetical protein U0800_24250 [Isosphaeraceae bacterium]
MVDAFQSSGRPRPALATVLPCLAAVALLVAAGGCGGGGGGGRPSDPRAELFNADEKALGENPTAGDAELSELVKAGLQALTIPEAKAERYQVFTRRRGDAVLVLVKVPDLKKYKNTARRQLLDAVVALVEAVDKGKSPKVYVGVKGGLVFGAIRTPPDVVDTGRVVLESKLYGFYDEPDGPSPPATSADPTPGTGP